MGERSEGLAGITKLDRAEEGTEEMDDYGLEDEGSFKDDNVRASPLLDSGASNSKEKGGEYAVPTC